MSKKKKDKDSKPEVSEEVKFTAVTEEVARKIQIRLLNKLYEEMESNPSASLFAVVERQLARLHMGFMDLPPDEDMTEEERQLLKDFEETSMDMDSEAFEK